MPTDAIPALVPDGFMRYFVSRHVSFRYDLHSTKWTVPAFAKIAELKSHLRNPLDTQTCSEEIIPAAHHDATHRAHGREGSTRCRLFIARCRALPREANATRTPIPFTAQFERSGTQEQDRLSLVQPMTTLLAIESSIDETQCHVCGSS